MRKYRLNIFIDYNLFPNLENAINYNLKVIDHPYVCSKVNQCRVNAIVSVKSNISLDRPNT